MTSIWHTTEYDVNAPVFEHMNTLPKATMVINLVDLPPGMESMETVEIGENRLHKLGDQYYPSITRVLRETDLEGQKAIAKWKKAIGEEKANEITNAAALRGTNWHKFCELYLSGETPGWQYVTTPENRRKAIHIAIMLNAHIKTVLANEASVVSQVYGLVGRLDSAAELMDGRLAAIDFKTGAKKKTGNRLNQAAIQGAFYADALTEYLATGCVDTVVVAQICSSKLYWQETPAKEWRETLREKITKYAEKLNKDFSK